VTRAQLNNVQPQASSVCRHVYFEACVCVCLCLSVCVSVSLSVCVWGCFYRELMEDKRHKRYTIIIIIIIIISLLCKASLSS